MPRPRQHQHTAARVAAHRQRLAREGRQRLDVTVTAATAAKLKAEAAARGCTIGEALEALIGTSTTTDTDSKATSAASTSQAPTRRTRRRCPRSGDPGVETRHRDGWDTFAVIVDGHQVGTVTKARAGWRGETAAGHTVEGRVATAAVNRVLKAAHQSGLLEANAGGA
ncbi:hypothetical protein [Thioalkalivibrio sulfidiphilus]|uniref:hypothetical protein n=1 Tax=Thioalkalivibrio sulfidiphilus TaxID=1033854 RepID=UPI003B2A5D16